jgi:carboxymethylenebutenolidase
MITSTFTIDVEGGAMPCYMARPDTGVHPAVIVLEGVYGFDDELRRITDLVAGSGYVGLAINYFYRENPDFHEPYTEEGRKHGEAMTRTITKANLRKDVAEARDWLNAQSYTTSGQVGTWGFGFGGTAAFVTSVLPGITAAVAFYGQSTTSMMPSGEPAPIMDTEDVRAPLLLVFAGRDEMISEGNVRSIENELTKYGKKFEIQLYENVGHSFFRTTGRSVAAREAADAWDRVQAFLARYLLNKKR